MRFSAWSLAAAALLFGIGVWPSPVTTRAYSKLVSTLSNPLLGSPIGRGVSAELTPMDDPSARNAHENVQADSVLTIRVSSHTGQLQFGMAARRDSYLPLVLFVALIVAAPLSISRKLLCLALGLPVIAAVTVASLYLFYLYILVHQLPSLYPTSEGWRWVIDFMLERWSTPPGNRVIAPLVLAASLAFAVEGVQWPALAPRLRKGRG